MISWSSIVLPHLFTCPLYLQPAQYLHHHHFRLHCPHSWSHQKRSRRHCHSPLIALVVLGFHGFCLQSGHIVRYFSQFGLCLLPAFSLTCCGFGVKSVAGWATWTKTLLLHLHETLYRPAWSLLSFGHPVWLCQQALWNPFLLMCGHSSQTFWWIQGRKGLSYYSSM